MIRNRLVGGDESLSLFSSSSSSSSSSMQGGGRKRVRGRKEEDNGIRGGGRDGRAGGRLMQRVRGCIGGRGEGSIMLKCEEEEE